MSADSKHTRIVLPPVNQVTIPIGASGEWEHVSDEGSKFIRTLAEALDVTNIDQKVARIFSIPDVWAQVELFKTAFGDDRHVLHERFVAAWRGMLALLALASFRGLPVMSKLISISSLAERPFHGDAAQAPQKVNLARVLHGMHPAECLLRSRQDQAWNELALVFLGKTVVGLLSPTTLLCPARGRLEVSVGGVPWIVDGRLNDPTTCNQMTLDDYSALHAYVAHLSEGVNAITEGLNHGLHGNLNSQFENYLADIRDAIGQREMTGMTFSEFASLEVPDFSIYARLNRLPSCVEGDGLVSDVAVPRDLWTLGQDSAGQCQSVVYTEDLPKQWLLNETDVTVWRRLSYSHLAGMDRTQLARLEQDMRDGDTLLLGPDDIFTEKIYRFDNAFIQSHPRGMESYILPLKPKVLYFLSPEQISRSLSMDNYGETTNVSLRLELVSTRTGERRTVAIKKRYPKLSERESVATPMFGVYPKFTHPDFRQYFFPYSSFVETAPLVDLPFSPQLAEKHLRSGDGTMLEVLRGDKLAGKADLAVNVIREPTSSRGVLAGVLRMDHQPSAIICRRESLSEANITARQLAGVILLPPMEAVQSGDDDWKVAIDLGSTNTSVHFRQGRQAPELMVFSPQVLMPLGRDRETWRDEVTRRLLPPEECPLPVLSSLEDFHDMSNGHHGPLIDGRVYYQFDINRALGAYLSDQEVGRRRIGFDLKWRAEVDDTRRLGVYIGQLAMQSLVEIVQRGADPRKVQWVFTYPLSMGKHMVDLEGCFKDAVGALLGAGGDPRRVDEAKSRCALVTESLASASYFRHKMKVSFAGSAITVDMGGVTSDICLWRDNKLVWQGSFKFGGRDLLIAYAMRRRELMSALAEQCSDKSSLALALNQLGILDGLKPHHVFANEMVVNAPGFGDLLDRSMAVYRASDPFAGLVLVAKIALAGLCAYLGMVTQHFRLQDKFADDGLPMKFCLGGRGSKLFKSVIEVDPQFQEGLKEIFDKYALSSNPLAFVFSQDPKQEVAYGALLGKGDLLLDVAEDHSRAIISGEDIAAGGRVINFYDELLPSDVQAGLDSLELGQFEQFLHDFSQRFGIPVPWDDALRQKLLESVRDQYNTEKDQLHESAKPTANGAGRAVQVSAPFITTLKTYIENWMDSAERMK